MIKEFVKKDDNLDHLIFKISNDALKDIELTLNFNGSKNIEISENPP